MDREEVRQLAEHIGTQEARLCELMFLITEEKAWLDWGFASFQEYVNRDLPISYRKAAYLRKCEMHRRRLRYTSRQFSELITRVGWTKVAKILPTLTRKLSAQDVERLATTSVLKVDRGEVERYTFDLAPEQARKLADLLEPFGYDRVRRKNMRSAMEALLEEL